MHQIFSRTGNPQPPVQMQHSLQVSQAELRLDVCIKEKEAMQRRLDALAGQVKEDSGRAAVAD